MLVDAILLSNNSISDFAVFGAAGLLVFVCPVFLLPDKVDELELLGFELIRFVDSSVHHH